MGLTGLAQGQSCSTRVVLQGGLLPLMECAWAFVELESRRSKTQCRYRQLVEPKQKQEELLA